MYSSIVPRIALATKEGERYDLTDMPERSPVTALIVRR